MPWLFQYIFILQMKKLRLKGVKHVVSLGANLKLVYFVCSAHLLSILPPNFHRSVSAQPQNKLQQAAYAEGYMSGRDVKGGSDTQSGLAVGD